MIFICYIMGPFWFLIATGLLILGGLGLTQIIWQVFST
jgi:hypothetical protein